MMGDKAVARQKDRHLSRRSPSIGEPLKRDFQERRSEVKSEIKTASRSQIIPFLDQSPAEKENETMISKEQMEERHGRKKENRIRCRREYAPRTARH